MSHEIKGHRFDLWPKLPVLCPVNCLHSHKKKEKKTAKTQVKRLGRYFSQQLDLKTSQ